jgi:hypothetical protein
MFRKSWGLTPHGLKTTKGALRPFFFCATLLQTELHHSPPTDSADFSSETTGAD